jgi:DMSO/TMAO reductase YedYZ molybdopterin-dependent catalytic subunit
MPRTVALLVSAMASAATLGLQATLREMWQIRTLPERVMEWVLLFIPLELFERGLQQFGPMAKEYALLGNMIGMALTLMLIGVLCLRAGWRSWRLLAIGPFTWLFTMAVVMPVTGAGFFATGLFLSPLLVNAGFLAVFLGYATLLAAGAQASDLLTIGRRPRPALPASGLTGRRAVLAGLGATLASYAVAFWAGRGGGMRDSDLPLAAVEPPTPAPPPGAAPVTAPPTGDAPPSSASQARPPVPTATAMPEPPPARALTRDKDGSLAAARRPKGTLSPAVTSNDDFYVVTKNAVADPVVSAAGWRLIIDGEVGRPVQLDYRALRALPAIEITKTLECISNFTAMCELTSFGCDLISNARWRGARLRDVLDLAGGLKSSAVGIGVLSLDEFSAGLPVEAALDPETLLVYEMNGQVLPREHGYPARLLVPGRYGMKNPKWLAAIRATREEFPGWYEQRNWNKEAIIKTMSRIDVPANGDILAPGAQRVAGIAYAGARGVRKVEFSADGGQTWREARLLDQPPGRDVWARWEGSFELSPGARLTLAARATDGQGEVQTETFSLPQPDGGSGRHSIEVAAG